MKRLFDRRSEVRVFQPGDQVLALLPVVGSPLQAKFAGPYAVVRQVSDLNYLLVKPDRRKATRNCHVNLLKPYYARESHAENLEVLSDKVQVDVEPILLAGASSNDEPSHPAFSILEPPDEFDPATCTINLVKCEFAKATVSYLGMVVGQGQVCPLRSKVMAIDQFPPPSTKKYLVRFLEPKPAVDEVASVFAGVPLGHPTY
ncbi:hypothetical protein AOLI_G00178420 [Acnodon oligacanthus]